MIEKKSFQIFAITILLLLLVTSFYLYYALYPNEFQINGYFSTRGINIGENFENSKIVASKYLFRTFKESNKFNMTIPSTRGWTIENLTIYGATSYSDPLIYDKILYQTNGSSSIQITEPYFLFVIPQNINSSIFTREAESAFFINDAGKSLLLDGVTSATSSFSRGELDIMFDVTYGNISISNDITQYKLENNENRVLIHLQAQIIADITLYFSGNFAIESNTFSSLSIECWSSPLSAYFAFPDGFFSHDNSIHEISGSQNLNFTKFRGAINLTNPQTPHQISIQGYSSDVLLGENNLTAPDPLGDLGNILIPFSALIVAIFSILSTTVIAVYRDRKKRQKVHLNEFKDKLFPQLLRSIENYFEPQIRFRNTGTWTFLSGLLAHNEYPVNSEELEVDINLRLMQDIENHFPELYSKIETFKQLLEEYNESYLLLAQIIHPLIEEIKLKMDLNQLTIFLARTIATPNDLGGETEWAFRLILGANERDLERILDTKKKERGLEILIELQKNEDVVNQVTSFNELCDKLEGCVNDLIEELRTLMRIEKIIGKCSM